MRCNDEIIELHEVENHHSSNDESTTVLFNDVRPRVNFLSNRRTSLSLIDQRCRTLLHENESTHSLLLEEHAAEIVRRMEQDEVLMEDNPVSEQLRKEALRDMPQCLTVKRSIKAKLTKTVNKKSTHHPLGFLKQWKYRISMMFAKLHAAIKNIIYSFELWYNSLKAVEGHFGSGVATYFKFLRWIFVMNFLICIPTIGFIVLPQLVYRFYEHFTERNMNVTMSNESIFMNEDNITTEAGELIQSMPFSSYMKPKDDPYKNNAEFSFVQLITGDGFLTNTTLFYGFYTNNSINLISTSKYNMPYAYFLTMLFVYITAFVVLSISMARSYRRSFIETSGGLKNIFAHKVFCGWDYSIATKEGADLKKAAIYNEIKELLSDNDFPTRKMSLITKFWTKSIQFVCHLFVIIILVGIALLMWKLLKNHHEFIGADGKVSRSLGNATVVTSIVVTIIMAIGPFFFTWLIKFEDYKTPRNALYVSLFRTFQLEIVVIGVLVTFWLNNAPNEQCWETSLGQEIYRLILIDFLFSVLFTSFVELLRHLFYTYVSKKIGRHEFDIARHTLQIIYNQTLFWMGLYFSPFLSVIVTVKLWLTWYIKSTSCLQFCRPSSKSWRAQQTQTVFLGMTFLALFGVVFVYGYIMTQVHTSSTCGPFRNYEYMYEMATKGLFQLQQGHSIFKLIAYLTKPGVITGILIAISIRVYYLRAKSNAQIGMVDLLREMLVIEAKDKEFLLKKISQITEGDWLYNLNQPSRDGDNLIPGNHRRTPSNQSSLHRQQTNRPGTSSEQVSDNIRISNHLRHAKCDYKYLTKRNEYK